MNRFCLFTLMILALAGAPLSGQSSYDTLRDSFQTFASDVANGLPALSGVGLTWSDAYIGRFPHFGVGVNYLGGSITFYGVTPSMSCVLTPYDTGTVSFSPNADLDFFWRALSIDLKAQASKNLAFVTLCAGAAGSYCVYAEAGGGITPDVLYNGSPITPSELDILNGLLPSLEYLTANGIAVKGPANGWGLKLFCGLSFSIAIVRLDLSAMLLSNSLVASFNARV